MAENIIEFKNISKAFYGVHALSNVSFNIKKGEIIGLTGENGAGKSTLMNILGGVHIPDDGQILLRGKPYLPKTARDATNAGIAFIHQELNLFTNLTIAENFFIDKFPKTKLGLIDVRAMRRHAESYLKVVGLDVSSGTLIENLNQGEKQMVEIAKALAFDAEIFIFDEPTASLTTKEAQKLFSLISSLKTDGKTIIYISHILEDVKRITDTVAVLRDGMLISVSPTSEMSILDIIRNMIGKDMQNIYPQKTNTPQTEKLLEIRHLSNEGICDDICFDVKAGEIVGFFGLMGAGRSEIARIIFGQDPIQDGEIILCGEHILTPDPKQMIEKGMAFVTENRREEGLFMDDTVVNNLGIVSLPKYSKNPFRIVNKKDLSTMAGSVTDSLSIKCGSLYKSTAKSLSGGNQQKVVIGKWMISNPVVFILDEPTKGIDVGAKYEVYSVINALASQKNAIMFISSEIEELMGICDRILIMSLGKIVGEVERADFDKEKIIRIAFRQGELAA